MHMKAESMRVSARSVRLAVERVLSDAPGNGLPTDYRAIQEEMMLALTRNLSGTQGELEESRQGNLELRDRVVLREGELEESRQGNLELRDRVVLREGELEESRQGNLELRDRVVLREGELEESRQGNLELRDRVVLREGELEESRQGNLELRDRVVLREGELEESRQGNLELRDRVVLREGELEESRQGNLELRDRMIRQEDTLRQAHNQQELAERRGDLLQLELDNLRQTRAIKLVTKYWRIRHKLRRKMGSVKPTAEIRGLSQSHRPDSPIPIEVTDRIAESKGVVVFLLTIEWYIHLFQRPQQLAQAFARLGYTGDL